ncbi:MAG: hypothetical protein AMXMBFR84_07820 [Candidatus Hydrogenedentota bacterium]
MGKIIKSSDPDAREWAPFQRGMLEEGALAGDESLAAFDRVLTPEQQAERMIAEAHRLAEQQLVEGYQEGLRRGEEDARRAIEESVGTCTEAIRNASEALLRAREQFLAALEPQVLALTKVILKRILHRESLTDDELIYRTVRAALQNLIDRERLVLHLNPQDMESMSRFQIRLQDEFKGIQHFEIKPDESVAKGGCAIETDILSVDARLDEQLERIFESLTE